MIFLYSLIILTALYGLFVTYRITKEKKKDGPMVCPLGAHCDVVVKSKFSSFFGIGLEYLGALYYGIIVLAYTIYLIGFMGSITFPTWYIFILFGMSIGGFLFSIYLTFVQAFYIKSWCSWCLCSACASTLIFIISLYTVIVSGMTFIPIFEMFHKPLVALHLLGFALGVGGATIADILFYRFLKDFKISPEEDRILKIMSQIIWAGLFILILSGIGLYLPEMEALNASSKFLLKVVVVAVITVNGSLLNLIIAPRLVDMSFSKDSDIKSGLNIVRLVKLRRLAFMLGAISFVSWYSAFILGMTKSIPLPFWQLLIIYIVILLGAIGISQIVERFFIRRQK